MQKQVLSIVAGAFTLGAVLLSSPGAITPAAHAAPEASIVQLAQHTPDLSILVEAVSAAGLVDALNGEQRLTVFAPTNEAFAALLQQLGVTKEELLASKELLTQVLLHHVVAGDVLSGQVVTSAGLTTLAGTTLTPELMDGAAYVNGARVVAVDIEAANGVVHVIDRVMLP